MNNSFVISVFLKCFWLILSFHDQQQMPSSSPFSKYHSAYLNILFIQWSPLELQRFIDLFAAIKLITNYFDN